ncbi:MAG: response regulator transcription factor [Acidobacteria bacterium]|nr:response regulator transcription factor [Acidobacteriota bacterium]
MTARILLVEDNDGLAEGLVSNLEIEGYTVARAADGAAGLDLLRRNPPDLVVLDLLLPGLDGYRVLKALREEGFEMPVLVLTARGEEADKVRGFRLGADDYVTKPFGLLELLARVGALLRRARPRETDPVSDVRFGDVVVDAVRRTVTKAGRDVDLTPKEWDLLVALLEARGAVVSRLALLSRVWGYDAAVVSRTVDTHVAELRRKLEDDPAAPRHILTARTIGYRLSR